MKLQKLRHSADDLGEECIVTHIINEIVLGGEFTVCSRAVPDSVLELDGWEAIGEDFEGTINNCDCKDCRRIVGYFKRLK